MKQKLLPWIAGVLVASLLLAGLFLFAPPRYQGNDDAPILRATMGYDTGEPAEYIPYLNSALTWTLHALGTLLPGVAWFSLWQLFVLWLSCAVVVKALMQCALRRHLRAWLGLLAGLGLLGGFALSYLAGITYTVTAALAGMAAVVQALSPDYEDGKAGGIFGGLALSVMLLALSASLRAMAGYVAAGFFAVAVVTMSRCYLGKRRQRPVLPAVGALLLCVVCLGGLYGFQRIEEKRLGLDGYLAWNDARTRLMDYLPADATLSAEAREAAGWSEYEYNLIYLGWYHMDANISTEAMNAARDTELALRNPTLSDRLTSGLAAFRKAFTADAEPAVPGRAVGGAECAALLCMLLLLACILALGNRKSEGNGALTFGLLAGGAAVALLLGYLAYAGRMPLRAALAVLLPGLGLLSGLLFHCAGGKRVQSNVRWLPLCLCCLLCLGLCGFATAQNVQALRHTDRETEAYQARNVALLDAYALRHPDQLIIYDSSLLLDRRIFPDTSEGMPHNLVFWGGWPARSPVYTAQLANFGIDGDAFGPADFLRENVRVATNDYDPWESLTNYLNLSLFPDIDVEYETPVYYEQADYTDPEGGNGAFIFQYFLDESYTLE